MKRTLLVTLVCTAVFALSGCMSFAYEEHHSHRRTSNRCTRRFESSKSSRPRRRDRIDPDDTITGTDRRPAHS
jgi:hypothetical protein